ncbi:transposon Ty3-I Gag-Pol polyprotein [Nephila pilipes]|uniref:Transposon Ty3-I Gag-Pol polyprotein n=1 Tax=Nephila pilipes TaxID=299642 RepID=A0A8X6KBD9_NEPPI|nr:transposon Ty3-I Gag-Pol polyprotein [Nephila pilipes]
MDSGTSLDLRPMYLASPDKPVFCDVLIGTVLKLPGEFFSSSLLNTSAPEFVQYLRCHVRSFKPVFASRHPPCSMFFSKDLFYSFCVFLLLDRVRRPLEPPYAGPYKVVKSTLKIFTLEIDGKQHIVSIDCLKLAHLFPDVVNKETPSVPLSDVVTRFGRRSRDIVQFHSSPPL